VSAALIDSPLSLFAQASRSQRAGRRRTTLEERLDSAWRALRQDGTSDCPICHTPMRLDEGVGRCRCCGSELS
jgi:hypothetical protein